MVKNPEFEKKIRRAPNGEFTDKPGSGSSGVSLDNPHEDVLELLAHSENYWDRALAVKHTPWGPSLDRFLDDSDPWVRIELARRNYGMEYLKNDPDWRVRAAVAEEGYCLEDLVNDSFAKVRLEVALKAYAIDHLAKDPDPGVKTAALRCMSKREQNIDKLIHPDVTRDIENLRDGEFVRMAQITPGDMPIFRPQSLEGAVEVAESFHDDAIAVLIPHWNTTIEDISYAYVHLDLDGDILCDGVNPRYKEFSSVDEFVNWDGLI